MLDLIIFDYDGVILDSFPDQYAWFRHISQYLKKSFNYENIEQFKQDYREPVYPDMYTYLGFQWEKEKDTIWQEYIKHKANAKIDIFQGIEQVIEKLSETHKLAIASSNIRDAIVGPLVKNNIEKYFPIIIGKEDLPKENGLPLIKPHPACILQALDKAKCEPENALYIGDHTCDIIAARAAKIPILAVTYGYVPKHKLLEHNPDHITDTPNGILEIISKL